MVDTHRVNHSSRSNEGASLPAACQGSTSVTAVYDKAGNLIDDGEFIYVYDAPALDSRLRQRELIVQAEIRL